MQKSKIKLKIRFYVMFISKLDCFIINFFYKLSSLIFKFVFFLQIPILNIGYVIRKLDTKFC